VATRMSIFDPRVDKKHLADGFNALKRDNTYDAYVELHVRSGVHKGPGFGPWHRRFIDRFEADLLRVAPGLPGLPYWPWDRDQALPGGPASSALWTDGYVGPNGDPARGHRVLSGPFGWWRARVWNPVTRTFETRSSTGLVRRLGQYGGGTRLPNRQEVADLLTGSSYGTYDAAPWNETSKGFRPGLEGKPGAPPLHNQVHRFVDGDMLTLASPNDPVFFLHHCYVDYLWWQWQSQPSRTPLESYRPVTGGPPGQNLNDVLPGFPGVTVRQVLDLRGRHTYVS